MKRIEFENEDEIKPLLKKIRQIEAQVPGLGFPILMTTAGRIGARYSNLGRGMIWVGPKTFGKGTIIRATNQDEWGAMMEFGNFISRKEINDRLISANREGDPVRHISLSVEDLTQAVSQQYWFSNTFDNSSTMLSEKNFPIRGEKRTGKSSDYDRAHRFDSVSAIFGCTNRTLSKIRNNYNWDEQWSDRYSVAAILYRPGDLKLQAKVESEIENRVREEIQPSRIVASWLPDIPSEMPIGVDSAAITWAYKVLLSDQNSRKRGRQYIKGDLGGLAALAGLDEITPSIVQFIEAFAPYYRVGSQSARKIQIVQHSLINSPRWYAGSVLRKVGWRDIHYLLDRVRELRKQGLLSVKYDRKTPTKSTIVIGDVLKIGIDSIDQLRFHDPPVTV